jgi:hypothetical protein
MSNAATKTETAMPKTQAEALALVNESTKRGALRIVAKIANTRDAWCSGCRGRKKKIEAGSGALYFSVGLRATTLRERQYARKGLVWHSYCFKCATK